METKSERPEKSYSGELMQRGKANEDIIMAWLRDEAYVKGLIDFREFRLAQRIDVDCGVETLDGAIVLAEIKSDRWITEPGNLCFECNRINHHVPGKWFYLGWGWRSPAQKLIVRNPGTGATFLFDFPALRAFVGRYIGEVGKAVRLSVVPTDRQKTTFNYLIPMPKLTGLYRRFTVPDPE